MLLDKIKSIFSSVFGNRKKLPEVDFNQIYQDSKSGKIDLYSLDENTLSKIDETLEKEVIIEKKNLEKEIGEEIELSEDAIDTKIQELIEEIHRLLVQVEERNKKIDATV